MNSKLQMFVGIGLLLAFGVLISRTGMVSMVGAGTAEDSFVFLPMVVKPSPPEHKIVFASDRDNTSGMYDIFIMNTDGTDVKNLTNTPNVAESYPAWSPDGTMIAFLSGEEGNSEVFVMSSTGENKRNVSNAPSANDRRFVWSPNSTQLAFLSDRDDVAEIYDVFVVKNDGTGLMNLTHSTNSDEWTVDWSPDGTKIVYLSDLSLPPGLIGHIVTMNADGTNKTTIVTNWGFNFNPVWSPNGSKIAFILSGYSSSCLALVNPNGTSQACVTPMSIEWVHEGILWSSSGSHILFEGLEDGSDQLNLFVVDVSDSSVTNVTTNVPGYGSPFGSMDWSADDNQIIYSEHFSLLKGDISIINIDGTGYNNLTTSENEDDRWPNWSPVPLP